MEFVRYSLRQVVAALAGFRPGEDVLGPPGDYVVSGQTLVPRSPTGIKPSASVRLPFSARLITIKSHARIFGLNGDESITAKVAVRPVKPGESFFREVRARRLAAALLGGSPLAVPLVRRADPARGWVIEEFVEGDRAGATDVPRLLAEAHRIYGPTRRFRLVAGSAHSRWLFARLKTILDPIAPRLAEPPPGSVWSVVLTHGDLGVHNMICGADGRLWLIDWEKAGFNPVAMELGRLYVEYPHLKQDFLALLARLAVPGPVLSPEQTLALGAAFNLAGRRFRRETNIAERIQLYGQSPAEARRSYDRIGVAAREAIAALAR
jgi:hypothetical protein